ncbi:MAG: ParB/RepB/Spo0J family partition protein [Parcubacteria group bacterium]
MAKIMGLGRGLGSLIPRKVAPEIISEAHRDFLVNEDKSGILQLPVESIVVNPYQPRQIFDHDELEELIESIKMYGVLQPLIVSKIDGGYQLIAGERRLRASRVVGLKIVPVIVRQASEQEQLELSLIENVQRKDLNPLECGVAYQRLMDEFNLTQDEVARKMGISRPAVANSIRLLSLPEAVQSALVEKKITEGHAKVIVGLATEKEQLEMLEKILKLGFTVRDVERESRIVNRNRTHRAMKDPSVEAKEDLLRGALNTKVNIKKRGANGQILIDFYSEEELGSIIKKITDNGNL